MKPLLHSPALLMGAMLLAWSVAILARGYWTPDEPREADIAWRMSWQADKAVPLLAGEAFCEKPPFTYWVAALPIRLFGPAAWSARLPNMLYALLTALAVGLLAARPLGRAAAFTAAAAVSTFLLAYQVAIWLATDAPLLAAVSVALLGAYRGFYSVRREERVRGYLLMHAALGVGFLCKSAIAWMVPVLTLGTLIIWERRWRELLRWELYLGVILQGAIIFGWIWCVYVGNEGPAHLKVFFWNNLVGRFTQVDAPSQLQYATAHQNTPGKYLLEMPMYLAPWTLLVIAAVGRAWQQRREQGESGRALRFAIAAWLAPLALLSLAATARNIYFAPALPGAALLLAWWAKQASTRPTIWDTRAIRVTAGVLLAGAALFTAAVGLIGVDTDSVVTESVLYFGLSAAGIAGCCALAVYAWSATLQPSRALSALFLGYCMLLIGPASQLYRQVDTWQDLASVARAIERDAGPRNLILFAPDETTRAIIDMYARTQVGLIPGPVGAAAVANLKSALAAAPDSVVAALSPGRGDGIAQRLALRFGRRPHPNPPDVRPEWAQDAHLQVARRYSLPNGRRYALFTLGDGSQEGSVQ